MRTAAKGSNKYVPLVRVRARSLHFLDPSMEQEQSERELQLLLPAVTAAAAAVRVLRGDTQAGLAGGGADHAPLVDLDLSMSIGPRRQPSSSPPASERRRAAARQQQQKPQVAVAVDVRAVKQQTAERMQEASERRAYAERVRRMARVELELAEKEFARARMIWERAREEVERVERMKEIAARRLGSAALEITCHACMQRFHP